MNAIKLLNNSVNNYCCVIPFIDSSWIAWIRRILFAKYLVRSDWSLKRESCAYVDTFTLLLPWLCNSPPCSLKNRLCIPVTRLVQCIVLHHFLPLFQCKYATTAIMLFCSEPKLVWVTVSLNFVRSQIKSSVLSVDRNWGSNIIFHLQFFFFNQFKLLYSDIVLCRLFLDILFFITFLMKFFITIYSCY